jgi:fucose permease
MERDRRRGGACHRDGADLTTPLLVALLLALGGSYRAALVVVALLVLVQARWVRGAQVGKRSGKELPWAADEETETLLAALRAGIRHKRLWLWLFGAGMCTFLDEIALALGTLRVAQDLEGSAAVAAAAATALPVGAVFGAWFTERALRRHSGDRVLLVSALLCLLALVLVASAPSVGWIVPALGLLGLAAAPQYALLQARAYAALPGRPGVVNALSQARVVLDIGGPLALGVIADRFGLGPGLLALSVQPLTVLAIMIVLGARGAN